MQHTRSFRTRPPGSGFITLGTQLAAAVSALVMVLMSACHSTAPGNAFASKTADRTIETQLQRADTMAPLQPFDEGFGAATQAP